MAITIPESHSNTRQAEETARKLLKLWEQISALPNLHPNCQNSHLFEQLFEVLSAKALSRVTIDLIMKDARVQKIGHDLRAVLSEAESTREFDWACEVVNKTSTEEASRNLWEYPYMASYREIVATEMTTIQHHLPGFVCRKIAMLGSGPLPLTSIIAQAFWGKETSVLNVDRDEPALKISSKLVTRCGIEGMTFFLADLARNPPDLLDCDIVYVAGMVGGSMTEKRAIITQVVRNMRSGAVVLLRTTFGMGELVYGKLDLESEKLMSLLTSVARVKYCSQLPREFHVALVN